MCVDDLLLALPTIDANKLIEKSNKVINLSFQN